MDIEQVCICDAGHHSPNLAQIICTFGLDEDNVLCVYICGSHLWGTCHKHSDWDFVIVVKKMSGDKPMNTHKGQLEAFIVSKSDYAAMVAAHSMQVVTTLWVPRNFVLKEELNPRTQFQFDIDKLVVSLGSTKERDYRVAQKHFAKSNHTQGKKVLYHFVSYLLLAIQIKQQGSIADYSCAREYREQITVNHITTWGEFLPIVQPIVDQLWASLVAAQ